MMTCHIRAIATVWCTGTERRLDADDSRHYRSFADGSREAFYGENNLSDVKRSESTHLRATDRWSERKAMCNPV